MQTGKQPTYSQYFEFAQTLASQNLESYQPQRKEEIKEIIQTCM